MVNILIAISLLGSWYMLWEQGKSIRALRREVDDIALSLGSEKSATTALQSESWRNNVM